MADRTFDMGTFMQQYQQQEQGGGKKYKDHNPKQLGLEPFKDGEKADNYLYINLFAPAMFGMFRGVAPDDYWVWFLHFRLHSVRDVVDAATGLYERQLIVCPKEQNAVTQQDIKLRRPVIFTPVSCQQCNAANQMFTCCMACGTRLPDRRTEDRCPSCEESEKHWSAYNHAWEEVLPKYGFPPTKKARYQLKKTMEPLYRQLCAEGTTIGQAQKAATDVTAQDKYFMVVLDYGKLTGVRKLREKEDQNIAQQGFLGGQKIFDTLRSMCANGKPFFDLNNPSIIVITKDTSRGVRYANLFATDRQPWTPFSDDIRNYLLDPRSAPDVSDFMHTISYNEHADRAKLNLAAPADNARPVFSVPVPPIPAVPAPVQQAVVPTAPMAVVAQPVVAPPPVAPPPVMAAPPQPAMAPPAPPPVQYAPPPPMPTVPGGDGRGFVPSTPGLVGRGPAPTGMAAGLNPPVSIPPPPGISPMAAPPPPPAPNAPPIPSSTPQPPPISMSDRNRRPF